MKQTVAENRSSYAFVTDPIERSALGPWSHTLLWESARPYIYARTTGDGRMIVGGEDDAINAPPRRDAKVEKKAATLLKRARRLFPQMPLTPDFAWGGTFAETKDG